VDNKNLTIGVLSITAVILAVGLIIIHAQPRLAMAAAGPGVQAGDYVLATGEFRTDEHLLYVTDSVAQRMIVYRLDYRNPNQFGPTDGVDLAALRASVETGTPPATPPARRSRGRRP
jgi:hypothetical protein